MNWEELSSNEHNTVGIYDVESIPDGYAVAVFDVELLEEALEEAKAIGIERVEVMVKENWPVLLFDRESTMTECVAVAPMTEEQEE